MTKRKFYRSLVQYEILTEQPIGDVNMQEIVHETFNGDWSGEMRIIVNSLPVDGKEMAQLLINQGSEPTFFGLNENGDDE